MPEGRVESVMPAKDKPGICIVGCGSWGRNLIRNFDQIGALRGIFDSNPKALAEVAAKHPAVQTYGSIEEVLGDSHVQGVVIATPAEQHAGVALQALRAGKDCFVEKPL